jgi:hypothetical protein
LGGDGGGGGGGPAGNAANLVFDELTKNVLDLATFKPDTSHLSEEIPGGLGGLGGGNDANDIGIKDWFVGVNGSPGATGRYYDHVTVDSSGTILSAK